MNTTYVAMPREARKRVLHLPSPELQLQVIVSYTTWVLDIELVSSGRATSHLWKSIVFPVLEFDELLWTTQQNVGAIVSTEGMIRVFAVKHTILALATCCEKKKMCLEELLVQPGWEARNTTKPSDQLEGKPGWVMLKSIESQSNHRWIIGLMFIAMLLPILMQLVKCHYCSHYWLLRAPLSKAKPINVYVSMCTYIKRYYCATISSKIKIFHPPRELFEWEGK